MDIAIHNAFLPHTDPEASLAFYRDTLGFEVRNDVGGGTMRWLTLGVPGQDVSLVLTPPAVDPGITDDERRAVTEMHGAIDDMLSKVAAIFEQEVDDMVDGLTSLLEPIIMVVLGVLVGVIRQY